MQPEELFVEVHSIYSDVERDGFPEGTHIPSLVLLVLPGRVTAVSPRGALVEFVVAAVHLRQDFVEILLLLLLLPAGLEVEGLVVVLLAQLGGVEGVVIDL